MWLPRRCPADASRRGRCGADAIRLPTYARRRSGAAETEGDAILHADAVRQEFGLDGTGVRIGGASIVRSDIACINGVIHIIDAVLA